MWTRERLAWVAGIVEGEGTISRSCGRPVLAVQMTDLDVIERLHEWTQVGTLNGPYQQVGGRKPCWRWTVARSDHLYALLVALHPFLMSRRRGRAEEALVEIARTGVVNNRSRRAGDLRAAVLAEHAKGASQWSIARKLGCSRSRVQQIVSA